MFFDLQFGRLLYPKIVILVRYYFLGYTVQYVGVFQDLQFKQVSMFFEFQFGRLLQLKIVIVLGYYFLRYIVRQVANFQDLQSGRFLLPRTVGCRYIGTPRVTLKRKKEGPLNLRQISTGLQGLKFHKNLIFPFKRNVSVNMCFGFSYNRFE